MKQTILLLVFVLGMFSNNVSAQTKKPVRKTTTQAKSKAKTIPKDSREYQVGDDGFEWYKIFKNGKWGAEDRNGNILVPVEFDNINYQAYSSHINDIGMSSGPGFNAYMGKYISYYNTNGKCVIPYTRHYVYIEKVTYVGKEDREFGTLYSCYIENGGYAICGINGNVLVQNLNFNHMFPHYKNGKFFYVIETNERDSIGRRRCGIADGDGNIIIPPIYSKVFLFNNTDFVADNDEVVGHISSIKTTYNPFANNPIEGGNLSSFSSSSSNNNSNNSDSGSGTTTVVVEHHRDPVPVQEWQQCVACFGSGKCPNVSCGGSGWYYIGDKARTCTRCHGSGKCTICAGKGGNYITVYK